MLNVNADDEGGWLDNLHIESGIINKLQSLLIFKSEGLHDTIELPDNPKNV